MYYKMIKLRNCYSNDFKVKNIILKLNNLDYKVINIFNKNSLEIILFTGLLTDNLELSNLKSITPRNYPSNMIWDHVDGIYKSDLKKIFIGLYGDYYLKNRDIFLHELGHAFDDIIGYNVYGHPISELLEIQNIIETEPFEDLPNQKIKGYYNKHPREYVANSFDMYSNNDETNNYLKVNHNKIWNIINDTINNIK